MRVVGWLTFTVGFILVLLSAKSAAGVPNIVPVPEPATFFLVGAGLIGIGLLLRKRPRS